MLEVSISKKVPDVGSFDFKKSSRCWKFRFQKKFPMLEVSISKKVPDVGSPKKGS